MGASFPTKPTKRSPNNHPSRNRPAWTTPKTKATGITFPQELSLRVTLEHAETAKQSAHKDKARSMAAINHIMA